MLLKYASNSFFFFSDFNVYIEGSGGGDVSGDVSGNGCELEGSEIDSPIRAPVASQLHKEKHKPPIQRSLGQLIETMGEYIMLHFSVLACIYYKYTILNMCFFTDYAEIFRIIITNQKVILKEVKQLSYKVDALSLNVNPDVSQSPDGWPKTIPLETKLGFKAWEGKLPEELFQLYAVRFDKMFFSSFSKIFFIASVDLKSLYFVPGELSTYGWGK